MDIVIIEIELTFQSAVRERAITLKKGDDSGKRSLQRNLSLSALFLQLVYESLRLLQIWCVMSLSTPVVDRCEQVVGIRPLVPVRPQSSQEDARSDAFASRRVRVYPSGSVARACRTLSGLGRSSSARLGFSNR